MKKFIVLTIADKWLRLECPGVRCDSAGLCFYTKNQEIWIGWAAGQWRFFREITGAWPEGWESTLKYIYTEGGTITEGNDETVRD